MNSTEQDLQTTHEWNKSRCKQQIFKINFIFVITFPFLLFHMSGDVLLQTKEKLLGIMAKEFAFISTC